MAEYQFVLESTTLYYKVLRLVIISATTATTASTATATTTTITTTTTTEYYLYLQLILVNESYSSGIVKPFKRLNNKSW